MDNEHLGDKRTRTDLPGPSQLLEPDEKKLKQEDPTADYNLSHFSSLLGANDAPDEFLQGDDSQLAPIQDDPLQFARQLAQEHGDLHHPDDEDGHISGLLSRPKQKEKHEPPIETLGADQLRALAGLDPIIPNIPIPRKTTGGGGRGRRKKATIIIEEEVDPESKWNKSATEKLIEVYQDYGQRRVVDEKLTAGVKECLEKRGNPAVTLSSADGANFFTILTVAAEKGVDKLVKFLVENFMHEFSEFDKKHALQAALRAREQEIAELLIQKGANVDRETLMLIFDVQMNDESKRKTLPLRAIIERIDAGTYPAENLYRPEILNRAIYADNLAALELLLQEKPNEVSPLLEIASPVQQNTIRAGRSKAQDIGEGVPPLAFAAVLERGECLEILLKHGADPNFKCDDMGGTLLHIVGFKNNYELIELLIERGADPRIPNSRGITVLSRTKGRKARKYIRDACNKFERLEKGGSASMYSSAFEGTLSLPSVQGLTGSPPMMQSGLPHHDITLPPVYSQLQHPMQQSLQMHQPMHQNMPPQSMSHANMTHLHPIHQQPPSHPGNMHPIPGGHQYVQTNHQSPQMHPLLHSPHQHSPTGIPSPLQPGIHQSMMQSSNQDNQPMSHQPYYPHSHQESDR